jgi:hypothetical protein
VAGLHEVGWRLGQQRQYHQSDNRRGRQHERHSWWLPRWRRRGLRFHEQLAAKVEFDILELWDRIVTGPLGNTFTFERDLQMLKIGLNYKF